MLCCATNRYLSSFKLASDKCDAFEWPADSWAGQGGQPCGDIQTNSANITLCLVTNLNVTKSHCAEFHSNPFRKELYKVYRPTHTVRHKLLFIRYIIYSLKPLSTIDFTSGTKLLTSSSLLTTCYR